VFKQIPVWLVSFSVSMNGLLGLAIAYLWLRQTPLPTNAVTLPLKSSPVNSPSELNYQQWLDILRTEAQVITNKQPDNLAILLGDSISQAFPKELLPSRYTWLNQGISGEGSAGLLQRLNLIENTNPQLILVMIGINDLLRGESEETIVANHQEIVRTLKQRHPKARIILQGILPHSDRQATWEGRDRLALIPNDRIRQINQRLAIVAKEAGISYLDLHSLFSDSQGNLPKKLSTDGLHLANTGYKVWSVAIQVFLDTNLPNRE